MTRLHVIDGTFELFRAHYSKRPGQIAPNGMNVKGSLGVLGSLIALLDDPDESCTHLAVAFDNPIESFRNDLFDGYKSGAGLEPEILAQMDLVEEATAALGVVVWSMDRFEADDALATAAVRYADQADQIRIMTPDKDLGQSVVGRKVVQVDRIRRREIDEDGVMDRNGVAPRYIPDWLALVGDTADGIPGVPGFGAKTSSRLIDAFGPVEAIPEDPATWPKGIRGAERLSATLNAMREDVDLYKELAILATDVPLTESFDDLRWRGAPRETFESFVARLGGFGMLPSAWLGELD